MPQLVDRARNALTQGKLVVFPTETVYGIAANALLPEAVDRLVEGKGRAETKPLAVAVGSLGQAMEWLPDLGRAGRRLGRRCWPGPLTLVSGEGVARGRAGALADRVRQRICPLGTLGVRVPDHDAILEVLGDGSLPVVLTSANRSGQADAVTPEEVVAALGDAVELVIGDGPTRYGKPSTVVRVEGDSWKVLREGVIPEASVARLAGCLIVFVCTGNTCRSPLAEALFKKLLAERLGCTVDELPSRGFTVQSAGLAAYSGGQAACEAVAVGREMGVDLEKHVSRMLSPHLAAQADYLVAMTQAQMQALGDSLGRGDSVPRLLHAEGGEIADPMGYDQQVYRDCAQEILGHLRPLVSEVLQR